MKSEQEIIHNYFKNKIKMSWELISRYRKFPPILYQVFKDKISLLEYSSNNVLTETQLLDNLNNPKINIAYSLLNNNYNIDFLLHVTSLLKKDLIHYLLFNPNIPEAIIDKYYDNNHISKYMQKSILTNHKFSLNFIKKHEKNIDFNFLSSNKYLDFDIIEHYHDKIDLTKYYFYNRENLNEEFIQKHINKIHLSVLSSLDLSENFFKRNYDIIDWNAFFSNKKTKISREFVYNHRNKINWVNFNNFHLIDENIIQHNINKCDAYNLSFNNETYSENFIKHNFDYFIIDVMFHNHSFSNEFLNEIHDRIQLCHIAFLKPENLDFVIHFFKKDENIVNYKYLPENFLYENLDKLYIRKMLDNYNLSENFIKRCYKHLPVYLILAKQNLSKDLATQLEINSIF